MSDFITLNELLDQLEHFRDQYGGNQVVSIDSRIGIFQGNRSPYVVRLRPRLGRGSEYITISVPSIAERGERDVLPGAKSGFRLSQAKIFA